MTEHIVMSECKRIAIVAHNNKKEELIQCLKTHRDVLSRHELFGTGTTGLLVEEALHLPVTKFQSGPFGGDQQIGAMIATQKLDMLFFIIDPLDCHPHDADVLALLRIAQVWGIVCVTTIASVDFILTSLMMNEPHRRRVISTIPTLPQVIKREQNFATPLSTQKNLGMNEAPQYELQHVPAAVPNGKKSTAQLRSQNVPNMKDKLPTKFPHILHRRRYPTMQQTVVKNPS